MKAKPKQPVASDAGRFGRAQGAEPVIQREGGRFGAGLIRGVSLASVGEALGHGFWLDAFTIGQIAQLAEATGDQGLKCRFTHPGMSSDGMGRHLGRLHNVTVVGGKACGDLHFAQSSHDTPDGDLAEYVMALTEEDPAAAGLSIVFMHDRKAEREFRASNQEEVQWVDEDGETQTRQRFKSPDPNNTKNYPHVRLKELRAADVVDEPAANPTGMFDIESLPRDADALLSYAVGISEDKPEASMFGVDSDRASQFLQRWLTSHNLTIVSKDDSMSKDTSEKTGETKPADSPKESRAEFSAELKKFTDRFGAEDGVRWFNEGVSFTEATERQNAQLQEALSEVKKERDALRDKLASLDLGEDEGLDTGKPKPETPKPKWPGQRGG